MAQLKNTTISDTGFLQLPVGTTAQRPSPAAGQMRFNTNAGKAEFYNAATAAWVGTAATGVIATGGTVYDVDVEGTTFRVHVFTSTGNSTFAVTRGGPVEYLIVAGGGPGGNTAGTSSGQGGGGGAGGLVTGITTVTTQSYNIAVGAGGAGVPNSSNKGSNGQNTTALGLTTLGGGAGGGQNNTNGNDGGSGGGGGTSGSAGATGGNALQPGSASGGFGNAGGPALNFGGNGGGGGGGGAGGAGATGNGDASSANGGIGLSSNITGIFNFYAGGGASGAYNGPQRFGGLGGGGNGEFTQQAQLGTPNTGGGGGGGASSLGPAGPLDSGSGASGIVVIRYPLRQENPVTAAGKTIGDGVVLDLDFAKPTVYVGTGTVVTDSRLNGITGTLSGPTISSLRTHRAEAVYTGAQSITITGSGISVTNTSFSIQWWVRKTLVGQRHIQIGGGSSTSFGDVSAGVSIGTASDVQSFRAQITDGSVNRRITVNPFGFQDSVWTMITYVVNRSNGTAQLYKDATLAANLSLGTFGNSTNSNSMTIHGENGSAKSVVKFYNIPLSADQVQQQYNATRWRFGV